MSGSAFPPPIAAALDRLTVPSLPAGFGERLIARIEAGELPAGPGPIVPPLRPPRRRFGLAAGWRRSGKIVAGVTVLGVATATAAASGFFGEPVYVPVVSETLAKAKLVELPKRETPKPESKPTAEQALPTEPPPAVPAIEPNKGKEAVRTLYRQLRADPEFRRLPPRERTAIAFKELHAMIQRGEVTEPELRAMVAEFRARRQQAHERHMQAAKERSLPMPVGQRERPLAERLKQRPPLDPAKAEMWREAWREMPAEHKTRLRELREQLRTAPPAGRPAIRREIREIWQSTEHAAADKIADPGKGSPDVVR
ncbi:MAG: hypothetical protein ACRCY3_09500 [Sphingorhabdus sp.]